MIELQAACEERAMIVAMHVECRALLLAGCFPGKVARIDIVCQATGFLVPASIGAQGVPVVAIDFTILQIYAVSEVSQKLVIGVYMGFAPIVVTSF